MNSAELNNSFRDVMEHFGIAVMTFQDYDKLISESEGLDKLTQESKPKESDLHVLLSGLEKLKHAAETKSVFFLCANLVRIVIAHESYLGTQYKGSE